MFTHLPDLDRTPPDGAPPAPRLHDNRLEYRDLLRLFEQAPGFVCFFRGPEHVYELQNQAHHRLAEFKDIIGKPVRKALPELAGQGFFELLDDVFATGVPFVGAALPLAVAPAEGGDVEQRYIDFVYQPIVDENQTVVGIFSQGSDVTERVLAQHRLQAKQEELEQMVEARGVALAEAQAALKLAQELQGAKAHLQRLFEQAPGFICVLQGEEHVFELANQAYRNIFGGRELVGQTLREILPEIEGQGFIELLNNVYQTGQAYVGRGVPLQLRSAPDAADPAGTLRFLDFVYQPVQGADGRVSGIFVQGSDVTEQRNAQIELTRYQTELESLVGARTAELSSAHDALIRSQKLEAIGKLTGGVAHDFNNILQVIGGNLQLLQVALPEGRATRYVASALQAVQRGAKLSSQLLAYARRQPLQPVVIDPARALADMDDMLRRVLGETIEIEMVKAGGLWSMAADPHQLENVLLNLAINARDAMPGGGKLTIEIGNAMLDDCYVASEPDIKPGQYVMFAISDTGCGMSPEVLDRACEPFFSTKPEGHGTGLGLSMAYGFVKQTGGHFKIYSEEGEGTTFKLYFPRSFEVEASQSPIQGGAALVTGGKETILVVEDDLSVQGTVVELLGSMGYRVLKADNADSALGILKSGLPIDLLFTDVVMPGQLRSPELARHARGLHPQIAVLFTSGYTQNAIVHGGRLDPGVELLSKPYGRDQLARKVRSMLAAAPAAAPVPAGRRILVVEDNPDLLEMACELLAKLGHIVQGAVSGEEALARVEQEAFDVLLTDLALPGVSGVDVARRARSVRPALQVIVASGYGAPEPAALAFPFAVLPKPYSLDQLRDVVATLPE
ncbi:response regulator [Massilia sp. S19_KUP03_FR1]|uniref:response regulator n=1 Tax=Massilia sp. S19_KUP03_FR1 TaxID=3025503 RepID=UPI002FCCD11D